MVERLGTLDVFPPAANYAYMDAASVALMNSKAADAINDWQRALATDGTVAFDEEAEVSVLGKLGRAAARLFNAGEDDIAVASSETVLMASLAWAVAPPRGKTIVATDICHPSTIYPWVRVAEHTGAEVRWVRARDYSIDADEVAAAIDETTAVVCLSHVEYGTGQTYDLKRFAEAAHRVGAILVTDATQSAGQVPIDATATGIDAAACSLYKWLCGPFGVGLMYVSPRLQALNPGIIGWRSHEDMWDFQADRIRPPRSAKRFEFGTMAYGCALGAAIAVDHLLEVTVAAIHEHNRRIADELIDGLKAQGAHILSPARPEERSAIVAARFAGRDSAQLARALKERNVIVSLRRDFLRFSPHLYNHSGDVEAALAAIAEALR